MRKIILSSIALLLVALTLGLTTSTANARIGERHTGDLAVTIVCNTDTGKYEVTPRLTVSQSNLSGSFKSRVGTSNFEGTPTNDNGMGNLRAFSGPGTYPLPNFELPGTTTGLGPWVYAFTRWQDGFTKGSDGQSREQMKGDCRKADVKDASVAVSVTAATCDAPASLVYGATSHATLSGTPNGTTGPANYAVTATAESGHLFADGKSTKTFTGSLDGKRTDQACFTQPPAERQTRTVTGSPNCTSRTYVTKAQERTRTYTWDGTKYVAGAWSAWRTTKTTSHNASEAQCPRTVVRGSVKSVDKCGTSGDRFAVGRAYGAEYVVRYRAIREGAWLRPATRRVDVVMRATSPKARIVGTHKWTLTFSARACTPPVTPPHTGA